MLAGDAACLVVGASAEPGDGIDLVGPSTGLRRDRPTALAGTKLRRRRNRECPDFPRRLHDQPPMYLQGLYREVRTEAVRTGMILDGIYREVHTDGYGEGKGDPLGVAVRTLWPRVATEGAGRAGPEGLPQVQEPLLEYAAQSRCWKSGREDVEWGRKRAHGGDRTLDHRLSRPALFPLSYVRIGMPRGVEGLNPKPPEVTRLSHEARLLPPRSPLIQRHDPWVVGPVLLRHFDAL